MKKQFSQILVLALFLSSAMAQDGSQGYVDSEGYWCVSGTPLTQCINIKRFTLDKDYQGDPVALIWEKFEYTPPITQNYLPIDQSVTEVAIECRPSESSATVQEIDYYQGAVQISYNFKKRNWNFQDLPPGSIGDFYAGYVCNGNFFRDYVAINGQGLSHS